jgi:hypothetical protein
MLIVLDLTAHSGEHPEGTATWEGLPEPAPFAGVLELLAVLEDAVQRTGEETPAPKEREDSGSAPRGLPTAG